MMTRGYNFGAGPGMLPEAVLVKAQQELLNWNCTGMSIMEIGHRTTLFMDLLKKVEQDLRSLLNIPEHYHVLFLSGPTRHQFAMVPLNLLGKNSKADYFNTGVWSRQAMAEAKRYGNIQCVADATSLEMRAIPEKDQWQLRSDAAYVHYTANETIDGLEFPDIPTVGSVPLVCDMTSNFLTQMIDVEQFGIIYVGAQKNVAPSGLNLAIIREDLIDQAQAITPTVFNYKLLAENHSLYYTPNTFACYMAGLMFEWIHEQGGVQEMAKRSERKSQKLYRFLDENAHFFHNHIHPRYRSRVNIPFRLNNELLENHFLHEANEIGLLQLKGHKLVGGIRASLYNAMPEEGIDHLIEFMKDFAKRYG